MNKNYIPSDAQNRKSDMFGRRDGFQQFSTVAARVLANLAKDLSK